MADPDFLAELRRKAGVLMQGLLGLVHQYPDIFETVRGHGLMLGLKCKVPNTDVLSACYGEEFIAVPAADNVLRLLPALNITDEDITEALNRIESAAQTCEKSLKEVQG